jgi:hypothetical protein
MKKGLFSHGNLRLSKREARTVYKQVWRTMLLNPKLFHEMEDVLDGLYFRVATNLEDFESFAGSLPGFYSYWDQVDQADV